ncbi:hypothetical protein [Photobacterium leiognathi]|uniref:hypothetical protein n=1 Tax=Photobacterium leiognathi TaxID=553611 RepID=UPI0029810E45|nr:hypothetical protein [Photobacterium leiognathi]
MNKLFIFFGILFTLLISRVSLADDLVQSRFDTYIDSIYKNDADELKIMLSRDSESEIYDQILVSVTLFLLQSKDNLFYSDYLKLWVGVLPSTEFILQSGLNLKEFSILHELLIRKEKGMELDLNYYVNSPLLSEIPSDLDILSLDVYDKSLVLNKRIMDGISFDSSFKDVLLDSDLYIGRITPYQSTVVSNVPGGNIEAFNYLVDNGYPLKSSLSHSDYLDFLKLSIEYGAYKITNALIKDHSYMTDYFMYRDLSHIELERLYPKERYIIQLINNIE